MVTAFGHYWLFHPYVCPEQRPADRRGGAEVARRPLLAVGMVVEAVDDAVAAAAVVAAVAVVAAAAAAAAAKYQKPHVEIWTQ